jgi:hypothetical protein
MADKIHTKFWLESLERKANAEDLGIDERVILKGIIKNLTFWLEILRARTHSEV